MTNFIAKNDINTLVKERILVIRPLPLAVMFFVSGLIACFLLFRFIILIYLGLIVFACALYFFKVIDKKLFFVSLIAIILSLVGLGYKALYNSYALVEGYYSGVGVVASIDSSGNAILENVVLEGEKLKGNLSVSNLSAEVGDCIVFAGNLTNYRLHETYELHQIARGIYYQMDISFSKYNYSSTMSFKNSILMGIRDGFIRCSNTTTADYIMSLMFGRSDFLDSTIRQNYIAIGVAHVFAVSGLHIGLLAAVLVYIFKKLKLNKTFSFAILSCILIFYAYLCSFSPSVIRATLVTIVSLGLLRSKRCADKVSIISFTALISLIIKPIWLFDISFILSYGAYIGILFLLPLLQKPFKYSVRFKKITNLLALNISVVFALIPLIVFFFGKYSLFGFVASFIVIPLTSLLYVVAFFALPFLVFKFISIPFGFILNLLVIATGRTVGKINVLNTNITFSIKEIGLLFWFSGIMIISDYVNLNWKKKLVYAVSIMSLGILL